MKYLSLCSGIEAATVAWHPLGWEAEAYSEIERFPSEVLAHHYPNTPNLGDMTKFKEWKNVSNFDVFVGGTPCQSFSVAGLRKGLDDPRGNLMLTYLAIAKQYRPNWLVWENVPGVLSSNGGRDFGSFLGGLAECGYGFAYRVLDAQYFGVAQRRKRVFVVGYLGDWHRAAAVLFERYSLQGHPAPSREKRQVVAPTVTNGPPFSSTGNERVECEAMVVQAKNWPAEISSILDTTFGTKQGLENQHINAGCPMFVPAQPIALAENTIGRQPHNGENGDGFTEGGPMYTLNATGVHGVAAPTIVHSTQDPCVSDIAFAQGRNNDGENVLVHSVGAFKPGQSAQAHSIGYESEMSPTLEAGSGGNNKPAVHVGMAVRRLTPKECERLQGFPDNYTDIKSKGKSTPDGPRYKALGNSMAVPVMAWIGQRIEQVEAICKQNK